MNINININEPVMLVSLGGWLRKGKITELDPNIIVTLDTPYHVTCVDLVKSIRFRRDGKSLKGSHRLYDRKGWEQLMNHRLEVIESAGVLTDPAEDETEALYFKAIHGLIDHREDLRDLVCFSRWGKGWASDLRRRMCKNILEYTQEGYYLLEQDGVYRRRAEVPIGEIPLD